MSEDKPIQSFISAGAEEIIGMYSAGKYVNFVTISFDALRKNKASMLIAMDEKKE